MKHDLVPRRAAAFQLREFEGESVLHHQANNIAIYLNQSASLVWRLCDGSRTVGAIETLLRDAYPDADDVGVEIETVLKPLVENGAIVFT